MNTAYPKKTTVPAALCFFTLIASGGLWQAVKDIRSSGSIQALHVLTDSFITPLQNRKKAASLLQQLEQGVSRLPATGPDGLDTRLEELTFNAGDLEKLFTSPNRYLKTDTAPGSFQPVRQLCRMLEELYQSGSGESVTPAERDTLMKVLRQLRDEYRPVTFLNAPGIITRALLTETLFSRQYLRKYEKTMEDESALAGMLRSAMYYAHFKCFGKTTEKVIRGKDGWLFYKQSVDYLAKPYMTDPRSRSVDANDVPLTDDPVPAIVKFRDQLKQKGIGLLVVIVPGKAGIYPEYLSTRAAAHDITASSHTRRVLSELQASGVETVDLHNAFLKEKSRDIEAGGPLYLKKDTHWRTRGLAIAANIVSDRIKSMSWYNEARIDQEYIMDTVMVERQGDLADMTQLVNPEPRAFAVDFEKDREYCRQVYSVERDTAGNITAKRKFRDDFRKSRVVVIGDSFTRIYQGDAPTAAGWASLLAYALQEPLAALYSDGGASTLVREKLARKKNVLKGKKLVVWEFIERDLRFGAEGWKDVGL